MTQISERITIDLGSNGYEILIGEGLLADPSAIESLPRGHHAAIVTDARVAPLFASTLARSLRTRYARVQVIELAGGESHKEWSGLNAIFDALLSSGADRQTTLFALGGGVVGDMAGFAAACYMRGIPFVQVPTTLLAQVDSSVGGKTGINHPLGKNMIGAFHQPRLVLADLDTLQTLPDRELGAGLAEVIKYGPIADAVFLDWIDSNLPALLARDRAALTHAIAQSCRIKAAVVGADERESGLRAILNFGHTFGHAIEAGTGYGTWLHGEAVGCGMVMAADLSVRAGLLDQPSADRIARLVARAGLPTQAPPLGIDRYVELMRVDKKTVSGSLRFVLLEGIGRATVRPVDPGLVAQTLRHCGGDTPRGSTPL